ncbi:MAG TPA: efflux RND transporter periplasmic adaptor subunit, partial [Gammaproteobacteria bacterium]|nr:efflux RND transporter periplasmic adaptor subunit [Gammaproteobacteria bacterium]
TATVSGTVIPYKEVTLTAQIPGRVELIAGSEGDAFRQGDVLVAIDDDDLLAKRRAIQAQIANAQAALQNARVQYNRELISPRSESPSSMPGFGLPIIMDNMFSKKMGDMAGYGDPDLERHADLYSALTGVNQAQASYMQANSALQELDAKIRDAKSIAPFDGIILKKMVEVGDTVQPGMPLIRYGHINYLRIKSDVPYRLVSSLKKGMMIPALLDNGKAVKVRVAQIYPMADVSNHTVTVKFDLPKGVNASPGMYAELRLPQGAAEENQEVVVPRSALIRGRSLPAVLVMNPDGGSSVRMVRLGQYLGNGKIVVLSGVKAGQRIVDNPPSGVGSGWVPGKPIHGAD